MTGFDCAAATPRLGRPFLVIRFIVDVEGIVQISVDFFIVDDRFFFAAFRLRLRSG